MQSPKLRYTDGIVATLLNNQEEASFPAQPRPIAELLRPDLLVDGHEPEQRVVHHDLSWTRYLEIDALRGPDHSGPRFYYLAGDLEMMSVSDEHERIKTCLGDFLADFFVETRMRVVPRGRATMQSALAQAGAEPDESWCLGGAKEFPDFVLEVALSSGGIENRSFTVVSACQKSGSGAEAN